MIAMNNISAFSMESYERIITHAFNKSYQFVTLREFIALGCPDKMHFVVRHDVDRLPMALSPIIDVESRLGIRSTTYIRVAGADYNPFSYPALKVFKHAESTGTEIGLHTSCFEYAQINKLDPLQVLRGELSVMRAFFSIDGIAPHRDINYVHNTLPFLQQNWQKISSELNVHYHAYEDQIMANVTYVNEGFNPYLCWRTLTPFDAIDDHNGRSIYMLTHPHWWYKDHPFEAP